MARVSLSPSRPPPPAFVALGKLVLSSHPMRNDPSVDARRQLLADFIKLLGGLPLSAKKLPAAAIVASGMSAAHLHVPKLSPRRGQILEHLLLGQSEKEVARELKLSVHTVHVHVKSLYKKFGVNTRAELLARCLGAPPRLPA